MIKERLDRPKSMVSSKEFVEKLGAIIVKLHRKRAEYKSQMEKQSVPYAIFSLVDVKNTYFLSFSTMEFTR